MKTIPHPRPQKSFKLPQGQTLQYVEYGQPDGLPLFYFHGQPGSCKDWTFIATDELTSRFGLRIIALNRPGIGKSTFQPSRRVLDWPRDVTAIADHLNIQKFGVLGLSAGGTYAAACAFQIPERLLGAGIVSGIAPHEIPGLTEAIFPASLKFFELCRQKPRLATLICGFMGLALKMRPGAYLKQMKSGLSEPDCDVLNLSQVRQGLIESFKEAFANPKGAYFDTYLMVSPWGFSPVNIDVEFPVRLWYGKADHLAPPVMGQYMGAAIKGSQLNWYDGEGHISLIVNHIEEILQTLADDLKRASRGNSTVGKG